MPQETKAKPYDPDSADQSPGAQHENLHGWIPDLASDAEIRSALEKAFEYRGDVTITPRDTSRIEGYIFDRRADGATLADCVVRIIRKSDDQRISIRYSDIARLEFTGRDTAEGKSFEAWVKRYQERKAAGEKNIRIEPEKLD